MQQNDKTIFRYLNPINNDMISKISEIELKEIFMYLDRYYLEYRNVLGFNDDITFGIEIEMEHFKGGFDNFEPFRQLLKSTVGNNEWDAKNDFSLLYGELDYGREVTSDILRDNSKCWIEVKKACELSSLYGVIGPKCGGHIHIGAQILGSNTLYWYRFIKLCSIYENIIYRFGYGEYLTHRPMVCTKAKPLASVYNERLPIIESRINDNLYSLLSVIDGKHVYMDSLKYYGISFWHMLCDNDYDLYEDYDKINKYCTVEYRSPNGTFDYVIWQNNINFIVNLLLYCKSDNFDDDILNKRYSLVCNQFGDIDSYSKIHLEQAIELSDMIFSNNLDKVYFLRQYLKSFQVGNSCLVKARKFTTTSKIDLY